MSGRPDRQLIVTYELVVRDPHVANFIVRSSWDYKTNDPICHNKAAEARYSRNFAKSFDLADGERAVV